MGIQHRLSVEEGGKHIPANRNCSQCNRPNPQPNENTINLFQKAVERHFQLGGVRRSVQKGGGFTPPFLVFLVYGVSSVSIRGCLVAPPVFIVKATVRLSHQHCLVLRRVWTVEVVTAAVGRQHPEWWSVWFGCTNIWNICRKNGNFKIKDKCFFFCTMSLDEL